MDEFNIQDILKCLPHRYPFLMIDKIVTIDPGKSIVALKNVSVNEPFFQGHFPNEPILPGVLMLEAMAQAAGILACYSYPELSKIPTLNLFAGVDNARFRRVVRPGDQVYFVVELDKIKREIYRFQGLAKSADDLVCSATLLIARKEVERD